MRLCSALIIHFQEDGFKVFLGGVKIGNVKAETDRIPEQLRSCGNVTRKNNFECGGRISRFDR